MKRSLHLFSGRTKLNIINSDSLPKLFKPFYFLLFCIFICTESLFAQETVIYSEGFETSNGNYTVTGGALWEWGTPTFGTTANSGTKCFATNLDGGSGSSTGYITSPAIAIPALTSDQVARARFYANINVNMSARGQFMVSPDGITWTVVAQYFMTMQDKWDKYEFDVSNFSGKNLYLRFYLTGAYSSDPGFFIDDIAVTVYNKAGDSKLLTLEASESASGSCPWIYPWDGTDYVKDNDIYSVARFTGGEYRDYYKLSKPLVEEGGKYKLEIREVESEESFTDFVDLIAVDHASDVEIAPDNLGNIFAYKPANLITPLSAVSNTNADVLSLVNQDDEGGFHAYSESFVDLDFGDINVSEGVRLLLKVKGFNDDGIGAYMPFIGPPAIVVQYQNAEGDWTEAGRLKPRFEWDECMFDLSSYLPDNSGEVKVRLYCISHGQKYHIIDYVAIEPGVQPGKTIISQELSQATFYENGVAETLITADNNYVHMKAGNHIPLEFDATPAADEKRTFIFVSEGYYIPRGSTYFIYTWDGENWINRDSYSYTNIDETKVFDLSLFLPDPDGEYKVRVWQDYSYNYESAIDYLDFEVGSLNGTLESAVDLRNNEDVLSYVQNSDNQYFTLNVGFGYTGQRDRWSEYLWKDLPINYPPTATSLSVDGATLSWTYADVENDPQTKVEVEIWSGAGGVGTLIWDPALIEGTQSQATYNGGDLVVGQEYYYRVKVSDGNNWSAWKEVSFTHASNPPVVTNDSFQGYCGETVSGNVLNNDNGAEGEDIDVAETPTLSKGSFDSFDLETGDFVYSAPLDYAGEVVFYYQATNGALSDSAMVVISVSDTLKPVYLGQDTLTYYLTEDTCSEYITLTAGQGVQYDLLYSETFTRNNSYCTGDSQYDNWVKIRSQLVPSEVTEIQASSSLSPDVFSLNDPDLVQQIALAFKEGSDLTLTAPDGNVWIIASGCFAGSLCGNIQDAVELNVNVGGDCSCGGDTYGITFRPCIANVNWGGYGSQTCSAPTQTLNLLIKCSNSPDIHYSDNCSATRTRISGLEDSDYYPVGTTTNTYKLEDAEGNFIVKDVVIEVIDTISPTLIPQDIHVYLDELGNASIDVDDVVDGLAIPCDIDTLFSDIYDFTCADVGANNVMLTAEDNNSNVSYASAVVTILDTVSPVVKTKNITVYLDEAGMVVLDSLAVDNGSADACGLASFELSQDTFYCENIGDNTVTLTVTDVHGNSSSATALVTVADEIRPTVLVHDTTVYLDANGLATLKASEIDAGSSDNCGIDTMYLSQDTFDCSHVGYVLQKTSVGLKSLEISDDPKEGLMVSLTAKDNSGNENTDWFFVTIKDTITPEVITKDITVYLDESGMVVLDSLAVDNGSSDACGFASFELSLDTFYCENVGDNTVLLTVTDVNGNVAVGSSTITVVDNRLPVIMAQDTTLYLNADGIATISVESIDAGSYDNCGIDTMYLSQDTFDCSYVGYVPEDNLIGLKSAKVRRPDGYPVWLTALDANGNIARDLFYVTVEDTIAPEVITKDITVYLDESGMVVLDSLAVDNGSADACGLASFELSRDTFYCENIGDNTVTSTVTDVHGNVAVGTSTVTVLDDWIPVVMAKDTTLYLNAKGIATISVESIDAGSYDNCSIDTMYISQDTFDCSYVGYVPEDNLIGLKSAKGRRRPDGYPVWLTAIDVNENTGRDIFYVTVEDTIAPEVITKDIVISLGEDGIETISTDMLVEESYDACGVELLELSQSTFKGTDVGANKIVITATDVNGNQSFYTSVVTVRDTIAPELWCQNFSIILDEEGSARIYPSFALDSTFDAGGVASYSLDENKFNCTDIGENVVTLTVKDYGGNAASCTSIVNVVDVMKPEVLCKDVEVSLNAQGIATIDPAMVDAGSTDICGIAEMSLSKSEFTGADLGENQVELLVTDISGNTESCTATITVTDEIAPEVTCNTVSVGLLSGTYELTKDDIAALAAGSYDNATLFDSLVIEVIPNSFSCEEIGDSVSVTVSVTDQAGNAGVCETKVYVDFPIDEELTNIEAILAAGSCEGTVDYPEIFTTESCATFTLIEGLGADGVFPLGTTTETWAITAGSITDTVSFNVEVKAENALPTLDSVADVMANEDEAYVLLLTGISDGGDCVAQSLSVTATSEDTDLIAGIEVDYTSPDSTAELGIAFVANQSGEAEIVVTVTDEGGAAVRDTFTITVSPVNDAPVLVAPLGDQEVRAGSTLELVLNKTLGVLFDDTDNDELTWSATLPEVDSIPSWISFDETAEDYVVGFSPAEPDTGCYSIVVAVQDADGAEATDTFEVCITGTPVGIEEIGTTSFEVKMYPNPTRGKVNVEYGLISQENIEITVHSAAGGEVFRKEYGSGEAIRFDLSTEVSGMYLVIIRQGDRQISKKLILDRE